MSIKSIISENKERDLSKVCILKSLLNFEFKFCIGVKTNKYNAKLRKISLSDTLSGNSFKLIQNTAKLMTLYRVAPLCSGHAT